MPILVYRKAGSTTDQPTWQPGYEVIPMPSIQDFKQ